MDPAHVGPAPGHDSAPDGAVLSGPGSGCDRDDDALAALYRLHYGALLRLAVPLLGDVAAAEDVVQDSFVALHGAWRRVRDGDKAVGYLRRTVINRARSVLRHRAMADRRRPPPPPLMPSAEEQALARSECARVAAALTMLSPRQREAVVLRYYAGLTDAQIAAAMRVSSGAVKRHLWRATASLRALLAAEPAGFASASVRTPRQSPKLRFSAVTAPFAPVPHPDIEVDRALAGVSDGTAWPS